jgi:hypothetical protein
MVGGRTRAALWREKTLVLRSIKDLEFDHAMGKVSDKDFTEMGARLRARATGLMRQLDEGGTYRDAIQAEIDRRLGPAPKTVPVAGMCAACSTQNDRDAKFCKQCGSKLA